jgi:hypothetical protein
MSISRKSMFISFALLLGMLSPMLAQGACSQSDVTGTWTTFAMSVDSIGSYPSATTSCKLKLKSTGKINTDKSKCYERAYAGLEIVPVAGGSFSVSKSCHLDGKIKMDSTFGRQTFVVDFGTLAQDKKTFSAVGYIVEAPSIVTHVTGVKK